MTRDEAVLMASGVHELGNPACSFVDMAAALGLLKITAPLEPHEILAKELGWGQVNTGVLKSALDKTSLKVVHA